jgi:hypothetical protein
MQAQKLTHGSPHVPAIDPSSINGKSFPDV